MNKIKSKIKSIKIDTKDGNSYFGFIFSIDDGNDYYFKKSDLGLPKTEVKTGMEVEFIPVESNGKRSVSDLSIIKEHSNHSISYSSYISSVIEKIKGIESIYDSADFEDACFFLLKQLGVHSIYQFERSEQAGKADGFFSIENLVVMYDCTLNNNFENYKSDQVENYINKLNQKSQLTIDIKRMDGGKTTRTIQILGKTKQVWIITKGQSREIADYNGIKVKEISIKDILSLFEKRIKDTSYDMDKLVNDLMLLDR